MKEIKLRPGQDRVLTYTKGQLAIPSVPGAGKTFTLTALTSKLIRKERHLPGKILIVTYMNSAVNNFRKRIGELLEREGLPKNKGFEVMTLHSLAMKIIKEKPEALFLPEDFQPIDELEQIRIIQRETLRWIEDNQEVFYSYIQTKEKESSNNLKTKKALWSDKANILVREMISYFKSSRVKVEDIPKMKGLLSQNSLLHMCLSVYEKYELQLRLTGRLDFDDLIIKSIDLVLGDEELREKLQRAYAFILEDEAQDSSILQEELLKILSAKHGNLIRVGDINQSIMSTFTLSDPKLFKAFCREKETEVSEILISSRSSEDIIDLANHLVKWTGNYHPVKEARDSLEPQYIQAVGLDDPFPNPKPTGYTIGSLVAKTRLEEFKRISANIAKQLDKNKTLAVLLPNGFLMDELSEVLEKDKIPYKEISSFPKERTKAVESLGAVLDYISHPHDNKKLIEILRIILPEEIEKQKIIKVLATCGLEDLLYPMEENTILPEDLVEDQDWRLVWENLIGIRDFLEASHLDPEALILFIAERLHFDENQMAVAQRIAEDIRYMRAQNPHWGLGDLAQQLKQIKNLYNYFANIVYERYGFEAEAGIVNLITYHKSKGLEFDTVYLTCLTSEEFPATLKDKFRSDYYFLKEEYKNPTALCRAEFDMIFRGIKISNPIDKARLDNIQERLRLIYVGITRAKENLLISSHEAFEGKYGKKNVLPSLYFHVLKDFIERRRIEYNGKH